MCTLSYVLGNVCVTTLRRRWCYWMAIKRLFVRQVYTAFIVQRQPSVDRLSLNEMLTMMDDCARISFFRLICREKRDVSNLYEVAELPRSCAFKKIIKCDLQLRRLNPLCVIIILLFIYVCMCVRSYVHIDRENRWHLFFPLCCNFFNIINNIKFV